MKRTQATVLWLGLLLVALSIRGGAAVLWERRVAVGQQFSMGDSVTYWELGRAVSEGRAYEYGTPPRRVMRAPAYPLLIATVFRVAGGETSVLLVRLVGAVLGTVTVAGIGWLTYMVFGRSASLAAGTLACFYPGAISCSILVLSEAVFCPLLVGQIGLTWQALRARTQFNAVGLAFLSGIAGGAAVLARPSWLLFTPLAWLLCCVVSVRANRRWSAAASALCGLVLVMTPWCLRNARAVGHPVITTLQVGASLYDGLNPKATGASDMYFVDASVNRVWQEMRGSGREREWEIVWDQEMRTAARTWAREGPGQSVRLALTKFRRMWSPWPHEVSLRGGWIGLMCAVGFLAVVLPALRQIPRLTWRDGLWVWLVLPAAYFTTLHMVFVSSIRYRQPPMLLLIVLAAGAYAQWAARCEGHDA